LGLLKQTGNILSWIIESLTIRRSDVKVVVMCLMAATTFWFLNALNKDYSTRLSYPIQFDYDDSVYVSVTPLPKKVRLNVSGYGWNLLKKTLQVNVAPLTYRISSPLQARYITGSNLLPFITEQVRDIRVNYIVEDTIFFDFDRISTKKVALQVDSQAINLAEGYRITSPIRLNPAYINFKGPSSLLKALPDSIFVNISLKGIDENFEEDIPVNYVQSSLIEPDNNKVKVNFNVASFRKETQLVPIVRVNFPEKDSLVLANPVLEVSYWLKKDENKPVRPEDFRIIADFKNLNRTDSTITILMEQKPASVTDVRVNKATIRVYEVN
jgi:hypothetical protein